MLILQIRFEENYSDAHQIRAFAINADVYEEYVLMTKQDFCRQFCIALKKAVATHTMGLSELSFPSNKHKTPNQIKEKKITLLTDLMRTVSKHLRQLTEKYKPNDGGYNHAIVRSLEQANV